MRVIRLRTKTPNTFWFLDSIHLTPFEDTSSPFDYDALPEQVKEKIQTAARVTGKIEIIESPNTREPLMEFVESTEPRYELPGQAHLYTPRPMVFSLSEEEARVIVDEDGIVDLEEDQEDGVAIIEHEEVQTPPIKIVNSVANISAEDSRKANKLLACKVDKIILAVEQLAITQEARKFLFACITAEMKRKNRKTVLSALENKFLSIPPGAE